MRAEPESRELEYLELEYLELECLELEYLELECLELECLELEYLEPEYLELVYLEPESREAVLREPARDQDGSRESTLETPRVDPALAGRDLGPWTMVPAAVSVPAAIALAALLAWYFVRLGRAEVPRGRRRLRRASIVCALAALVPLVRALTFVHPHEDRVGWAVSWSIVLFALTGWALLAVIDFVLVARSGLREYDALRRETFGAPRENAEVRADLGKGPRDG